MDQLYVIREALEFYSRIGILQIEELLNHPTIENLLVDQYSPKKEFEIGDQTMQGKIVKLDKNFVWTKGTWGNDEEVRKFDRSTIKHSPDWNKVHETKDQIRDLSNKLKQLVHKDLGVNASLGIHSNDAHDTCRTAFDMYQIIRNECWKQKNPEAKSYSRSSYVFLTGDTHDFNVEI
jgi:hypothetical protein